MNNKEKETVRISIVLPKALYDGIIKNPDNICNGVIYDAIRAGDVITDGPVQNNWTPCSERLPEEEDKDYWVCLDNGGQCQCRWTNDVFGLGAHEWSEWGWSVIDKPQYARIVAWQPLQEPYKGEEE